MKLKLQPEEWKYVIDIIESNVISEKQMINFYNVKNNDIVDKQVERAVNNLDKKEAENLNVNVIKGIIDLQTKLFKNYKKEIITAIQLAKEVYMNLDLNKIECNMKDCDKIIKLLKCEVVYNKKMYDEMVEQKKQDIFKGVCEMYKEEYSEEELNNPEIVKMLKEGIDSYFDNNKDIATVFSELKSEVTNRENIIKKIEESKIEAMN